MISVEMDLSPDLWPDPYSRKLPRAKDYEKIAVCFSEKCAKSIIRGVRISVPFYAVDCPHCQSVLVWKHLNRLEATKYEVRA